MLVTVNSNAANVTIGNNGEFLLNNKPFFPIMQWLQNSTRISEQAGYGINLFCVPGNKMSAKAWCDVAAANKVYACNYFNKEDVPIVKDHPAFFGWFFGDEPDLNGKQIKPDSISKLYSAVKAADQSHPTFLTITSRFFADQKVPAWMNGSKSLYYEYPKFTDVIGFDFYPVYGWCKPDWVSQVGEAVQELSDKYVKAKKPVYAWIECMKTSSQWCDNTSRDSNDGPYPYETEAQIWLSIIHGAKGIGYFSYSWECPGFSQWCVSEEMKQMIIKTNSTITALTDVICSPDRAGLTVSVTGIGGNNGRIDACLKTHNDSIFIIATHAINIPNTSPNQRVTFKVPEGTGPVKVYGENRIISDVNNGTFSDTFTTRQPVHIYSMKSSFSTNVTTQKINNASVKGKFDSKILLPFGSQKQSDGTSNVLDLKGAKFKNNKSGGSSIKIKK